MDRKNIIVISVSALLLIVIIVLWNYLILSKNNTEIRTLKDTHTKVSAELSNARRVAASLEETKRKYKEMELQWEKASDMLPTSIQTQNIIRLVGKAASQNNIKILKFSPIGAITTTGDYSTAKYKISLSSDYNDFGAMITNLGMLKRIIKPLFFNVKDNPKAQNEIQKREGNVIADITIETYALNPALKPSKQTDKTGGKK
mgnify:FL=1